MLGLQAAAGGLLGGAGGIERGAGVAGSVRDTLAAMTDNPFGRVEVPGSLSSLIELRLGESGHDAVGFAVHVPHYLVQVEYGDAAIAALECVTGLTGLAIPAQELAAIAGLHRADIAKQVLGTEGAISASTASLPIFGSLSSSAISAEPLITGMSSPGNWYELSSSRTSISTSSSSSSSSTMSTLFRNTTSAGTPT